MAESLTVRQAESVRLMIDSTKVVNRLQDHLLGDKEGKCLELSATQIQAAKILLDKSLPSLQSADITAHSSPQIESEEALVAQLKALITKYPHLINQLTSVTPAIPAASDPTPTPDQSDMEVGNIPGHSSR